MADLAEQLTLLMLVLVVPAALEVLAVLVATAAVAAVAAVALMIIVTNTAVIFMAVAAVAAGVVHPGVLVVLAEQVILVTEIQEMREQQMQLVVEAPPTKVAAPAGQAAI